MELVSVTVSWTCGGVSVQAALKCPTCETVIVRPMSMIHQTQRCAECHALTGSLVRVKGTRLYSIWSGMKTRCYNPNRAEWHRYGGRGITVCDVWRNNFQAFKSWALGSGFRAGLTIERRNNNAGYSPENCTWIPQADQSRNSSMNRVTREDVRAIRVLIAAGVRGSDIARLYGINKSIVSKIKTGRGWRIP